LIQNHQEGGFTLFEVVVVLIIASILAVSVIPRWDTAQANLNRQADLLARNLQHVQTLAMQRAASLSINFSAGSYSVKQDAVVITDPATGNPFTVTLEDGVFFSSWGDFSFDSLGRPLSGVDLFSAVTSQTLTGGGRSRVVTTTPITGAITVTEG